MDRADDPRAPSPRVDDRTDSATAPPSSSSDPHVPTRPPAPTPTDTPSASVSMFGGWPLTALLALVCGLAGSYIHQRFFAPLPAPAAGAVGVSSEGPAADAKLAIDATGPRTASPTTAPAARDRADRLDKLSQQLNALQKQVDAQSRSGPPPEVASLQVRIADLTDATNNLAPLPSKVDHLKNRVTELSGTVTALGNELTSFQSRFGPTTRLASGGTSSRSNRPAADAPSTPSTSPTPLPDDRHRDAANKPEPALADARALSHAADLLRRGRYREASNAFSALEVRYPDDARVWYYAALSVGFSTSDWTEAAVQLVEKGMAREAAGTPATAVIDAEFKDLTSATGKDWLAAYRKRVNATSR